MRCDASPLLEAWTRSVCVTDGAPRGPSGEAWCVVGLGAALVGGGAAGGDEADDVFCDCLAALVDSSTPGAAPWHWLAVRLAPLVPAALLLLAGWIAFSTSAGPLPVTFTPMKPPRLGRGPDTAQALV